MFLACMVIIVVVVGLLEMFLKTMDGLALTLLNVMLIADSFGLCFRLIRNIVTMKFKITDIICGVPFIILNVHWSTCVLTTYLNARSGDILSQLGDSFLYLIIVGIFYFFAQLAMLYILYFASPTDDTNDIMINLLAIQIGCSFLLFLGAFLLNLIMSTDIIFSITEAWRWYCHVFNDTMPELIGLWSGYLYLFKNFFENMIETIKGWMS